MEFSIINKMDCLLLGFTYYPIDDLNDYSELNIYFFIIVFHFKFY